jgi:hypothetical protein
VGRIGEEGIEAILNQPWDGQAAQVGDDQSGETDQKELPMPMKVRSDPGEFLENVTTLLMDAP